jgi:hypothetical protein
MNEAYIVPSEATATAGSQALTFEPTDPGTETGLPKLRPPLTDRANLNAFGSVADPKKCRLLAYASECARAPHGSRWP